VAQVDVTLTGKEAGQRHIDLRGAAEWVGWHRAAPADGRSRTWW